MRCPRHPGKRTVAACKDCGEEFCIDCVRETDQTTYCPDCYRRRLKEVAECYTPISDKESEGDGVSTAGADVAAKEEEIPVIPREGVSTEEEAIEAAPPKRSLFGKLGRKRSRGEGDAEEPAVVEEVGEEDFLSRGPDEDFSVLKEDSKAGAKKTRLRRVKPPRTGKKARISETGEEPETPTSEKETGIPPGDKKISEPASASDESLLQDVVSTLLVSETAKASAGAEGTAAAAVSAAEKDEARRRERAEKWSFLAQPRSSQYTILTSAWWKSALFIALVLLVGALLWALPNAFLIPKDSESGLHAVFIGILIGLAFWWKAGKAHGTKLAIQASLTTLFAIIIGEFLHWFLVVVKHEAFRTIFFDLISFKFVWENGPEIMRYTIESMFPVAFIWILLFPTAVAFIIGFGMPPIPEVFFQIGRAMRGKPSEKEEAGHGVEG
ncbi:MAG: B-box zinc finger protein [Actinomycetota bacterium]|nr:B-box zinc finger protein [Actinomycetota bacterium]